MRGLRDKVILLTGAGGVFGRAITSRLLAEGAKIVATDVRTEVLPANTASVVAVQHDVRDERSWAAAIDAGQKAFGRIDGVINNAGVANLPEAQDPEHVTLNHWRVVHSVNVEGVLLGCQAAIRAMKETGGVIVNISSISALQLSPKMAAYGASKAAVRQLTMTVAAYCAQQGYKIRCNSLHPGWIDSELIRGARTQEELEAQMRAVPVGYFGSPEDVAAAVAFLCSDESSYFTGAKLVMDGGIAMQ
jgi:NAD(P)-dependent dehydrogenase (short-subunit alcohol dehydrogenase family)